MILEFLAQTSGRVKAGADILTVAGSISALLGVLTQFFGLLAAILSFTWAALRLYEALSRKKHCGRAAQDCPILCPPGCVNWRVKKK
jgi:hypothetical protein